MDPHDGISTLLKDFPESFHTPSPHEDMGRRSCVWTGSKLSTDAESSSPLILDFQPPEVWEIHLLLMSHLVSDTLLQQPSVAKTHRSSDFQTQLEGMRRDLVITAVTIILSAMMDLEPLFKVQTRNPGFILDVGSHTFLTTKARIIRNIMTDQVGPAWGNLLLGHSLICDPFLLKWDLEGMLNWELVIFYPDIRSK